MENNFELPDKWAIKQNNGVGEWFNKQKGTNCESYKGDSDDYLHSYNLADGSILNKTGDYRANSYYRCTVNKPDKGFIEITYEQFKKHVLKKSVIKQKENYDYLIPTIEKLNKS